MKTAALTILSLFISASVYAQNDIAASDTTGVPQTFNYTWEGKDYTMQKYFIVFLKSGESRSQSAEEAAALQKQHLAYLGNLYNKGIINLNGPTDGEGEIRGFSVYNVPTAEQARRLASADPMVKAGRLKIEVHPWWLAKGSGVK